MKLATYKDGSRDGQLIVVSRDLASAHFATGIASRMAQLLDDWNFLSPQLEDLSAALNDGKARHAFAFDARLCMAPMPRACQWAVPATDGDAMRRLGSDHFQGPRDAATAGMVVGAGLAALTGDLALGATKEQALDSVRLLMLVNQWTIDGVSNSDVDNDSDSDTPAAAFGPVAVTPDELGEAWRGGRVHLTLQVQRNGKPAASADAGRQAVPGFGTLMARLTRLRRVQAGAIVGTGALVTLATLASDGGDVPAWAAGDTLRIEVTGRDGGSVFGAIEQTVI